ncbi:hypothetical protein MRX96_031897 [Rhipicephalus microplus]
MPNWYYSKKALRKTPSYLDGISVEKEQRYRREGARFIINVGTKMGLRYDTMATGVVYFHRFYMFHSFKTFPRFITACCCLFLAGKVEETPKKCKDIIKTARSFLTDKQYLSFGEDPKEEVMTMERILLQTIKFDLQVSHPYGFLLKYAKCLKGDKSKLQKMVQMAWTFINDSLCTTLCLQWEPERWWEVYVEDITVELLEDICHQVLDLYSTPIPNTPQDSPPDSPVLPVKSGKRSLPPSPPKSPAGAPPIQLPAPQLQQAPPDLVAAAPVAVAVPSTSSAPPPPTAPPHGSHHRPHPPPIVCECSSPHHHTTTPPPPPTSMPPYTGAGPVMSYPPPPPPGGYLAPPPPRQQNPTGVPSVRITRITN